MRHTTTLIAIIALIALSSVASAAMSNLLDHSVSYTVPGMDGYVINDFLIETDVDWTTAIVVVTPDQPGQIYQNGSGDDLPPDFLQFGPNPTLEWDTYFCGGKFSDALGQGTPVDFAGTRVCDTDAVDVLYYTVNTNDTGILELGRIVLADTSQGTYAITLYNASSAGTPQLEVSGSWSDGILFIPEPATILVMFTGGLALLRRRK